MYSEKMKQLRDILESVFDKDLVEKDPLDWSWFTVKPKERYDLFLELSTMILDPEEYWPDWIIEDYKEHELEFDYITNSLRKAFNKQGGESWIRIDEFDFEEIGERMTEEEIESQNYQLEKFFSTATDDQIGGKFVIDKGKFPEIIEFMLKETGWWDQKGILGNLIRSPKQWALDYFAGGTQTLSLYICPKGLDPIVKKLLYD